MFVFFLANDINNSSYQSQDGNRTNGAHQLHRSALLMSAADIQNFIYTFYPFMFGIYPYTAVTEKQKTAMREAGVDYVYKTVYELTSSCLIRLLGK